MLSVASDASLEPAAATAALGNIANNAAALQESRLLRFTRRQRSSTWLIGAARQSEGLPADSEGEDWVRPPRPARCRWRVGETVGVHGPAAPGGLGHFSGLERCGSIWACPVCSAVIRAGRAREIARALDAAHDLGHGVAFVTLTLRHSESDALETNLDTLAEAWRSVTSWRAWKRLRERLGVVGLIRSTEITYGGFGWHPHAHLVMVTERPLTEDQRAAFEGELASLWQRAVAKRSAVVPSLARGVDVRLADGAGTAVSEYLAKVQEHDGVVPRRSVALELARGDLKRGRAGSVMPFELLDDVSGRPRPRELWLEYFAATHGRRAFSWSRGLRELLIPDEVDLTDEELIAQAEAGDLVGLILGEEWDVSYRDNPSAMSAVLVSVEGGCE